MHTGHYISGAGHLGLIGWLLLGGLFAAEPEPFELTEVSVISGADFDAMIAAQQPPQSVTEVAQPAAPEAPVAEPEVVPTPDEVVTQPEPLPTEVPPEDTPPEVTEVEEPPAPEVEDIPSDLSEPIGDIAVLVPEVAPEAAPEDIERVAPEPIAQPEPEATPDLTEQEAVTPDEAGEAPDQDTQEATAPEAATTEIVTEATAAPAASTRPPGRRPAAPARQVAAAPEAEVEVEAPTEAPASEPVNNDDILAALQAAEEPSAPSGPPLNFGEKESLRVAVAQCWNAGSLSTAAKATIVVVSMSMNRDGTPVFPSIRLISSTGGSDSDAQVVFSSAKRAIQICSNRNKGFKLPPEKFDHWKTIEMTFDPTKMGF